MTASLSEPRPAVVGEFDDPRFARLAVANAEKYRSNTPFPHVVIDDFLGPDVARAISDAFPAPEHIDWVIRDNSNNLKRYQHDETKLPPVLRHALREFNSRQFLLFLESLTGIDNLIPDPYFIGGGAHLSRPGDFLKVHADFNWHHQLQAHRRVIVLFYATPGWREEWGGALEVWDKHMTRCCASYFVLQSGPGVQRDGGREPRAPHPLASPEGIYRRTLNSNT